MEAQTKIDNLLVHAKEYVEERLKLINLNIHDKVSVVLSGVASMAVLLIAGLFTLFFLSIALSWWIGKQMDDPFLGFLIVGCLYFLIALLIYANRNNWIRTPVNNAFLKNMADEND